MTFTKDNITFQPKPTYWKFIDLEGQVFTRLTVLGFCGRTNLGMTLWWCECVCGQIRKVLTGGLRNGSSKSCGCLTRSGQGATHRMSFTPEYNTWVLMKGRCLNPNNQDYAHYGMRGIKVCDRWLNSFENFFVDMGKRPSPKHTIERIDNNGNYEPKNCEWATRKKQSNNRGCNHYITFQEQTKTLAQWSEISGISYGALKGRLKREWDIEDALTIPVKTVNNYKKSL